MDEEAKKLVEEIRDLYQRRMEEQREEDRRLEGVWRLFSGRCRELGGRASDEPSPYMSCKVNSLEGWEEMARLVADLRVPEGVRSVNFAVEAREGPLRLWLYATKYSDGWENTHIGVTVRTGGTADAGGLRRMLLRAANEERAKILETLGEQVEGESLEFRPKTCSWGLEAGRMSGEAITLITNFARRLAEVVKGAEKEGK
jgi:hypothetical protein